MPRGGPVERRQLQADPIYNSVLVTQLINRVISRGKKSVAEKIVYRAFDLIKERTNQDPAAVFTKALDNTRPELEVRSRRVGGATYQVPVEVRPARATTLAIRWMVKNAKARKESTMVRRLAGEIQDAANGQGASVKRREDLHKMAESNKTFAHYRW
jgi:small subunit ribosomal protein S7